MLPVFVQRKRDISFAPTATTMTASAALLALCALAVAPRVAYAQETPVPAQTTPAPAQATQTAPPAQTTTPATQAQPAQPASGDSDDDKPKKRFSYGPEVGVYIPTDNKTRSAFGDAWFSFGVGLGEIQQASSKGRIQADFGLFGTSHGGGHQIYIAPLGVSYIRALGKSESSIPYYGVSADVILTQIRSDPDGIVSRVRGTGGGSVMIGESFNRKTYIQARYFLMGSIRGYNLSGLNLSTGYRF